MSILRADSIRDRAGTGAPDFPNGLTGNLTGTATTATTNCYCCYERTRTYWYSKHYSWNCNGY